MKNDVVAITVTFNRSEKLIRNVNSLLSQKGNNLEKIIIVDNNSSFTHKEAIYSIVRKHSRMIDLIELDENMGGAGGFYEGLKYAYTNYKVDWFWIMDDDTYPTEDCLNCLLEYRYLDNIGCLLPLIYGIDTKRYQLYHYKDVSKDFLTDLHYFRDITDINDVNEVRAGAFVGPLISRQAISENGFPDPGLFIYGDDFEYLYRLSINRKNYLIKKAIIHHEDIPKNSQGIKPEFWWKQYYKYRNKYLFISKYCKPRAKKVIYQSKLTIWLLLKIIKENLVNPNIRGNRYLVSKTIFQSIVDGIRGKRGKVIDPQKYLREVK